MGVVGDRAGTLVFDQTTDTVMINGQTVLGASATFEARVKLSATSSLEGSIFTEWTDNAEDKMLRTGPNLLLGYGVLYSSGAIEAYPTVTQDVWHHVAYVFDGAAQRLYLDGQLVKSLATSGSFANGCGTGYLGGNLRPDPTWARGFIGELDTFRISRTTRYVGASFTPPAGDLASDPDTLLLYNFNEPAGTEIIEDLSGNGHTGTLGVGFPWLPRFLSHLQRRPLFREQFCAPEWRHDAGREYAGPLQL
jgi:hypothetical protein